MQIKIKTKNENENEKRRYHLEPKRPLLKSWFKRYIDRCLNRDGFLVMIQFEVGFLDRRS